MILRKLLSILLTCWVLCPLQARCLEQPEQQLEDVGVTPILGNKVDLDLEFTASTGQSFRLRDIAALGKPLILVPVYYGCPRLCGLVLNGVLGLLNTITLRLGKDFKVVALSFDPEENSQLANERKVFYQQKLVPSQYSEDSLVFAVGSEANIKQLMQQISFRYRRDGDEFAHSSAIILLTPDGQISQYFTGIDYPPWDVRLALVEASHGNIGSPLDHILLYCFRFDQTKGRYIWAVVGMLRVGGALTLLGLVILIGGLIFRERSGKKKFIHPALTHK